MIVIGAVERFGMDPDSMEHAGRIIFAMPGYETIKGVIKGRISQ